MNATFFIDTFRTPLGPFSVAVNDAGALVATAFGSRESLQRRLGPFQALRETGKMPTRAAREQILAYFAGECRDFDLPLAPVGTAFQEHVWAALRRIPFGETRSYGELARALQSSPRAVGRANATNPLCLIVPCHRVIGADGSLTGFAFGEEIKAQLLAHERSIAQQTRAA